MQNFEVRITYTNIINLAKFLSGLIALALMIMIFMTSSEDNFGEPVKVETKGLDFSSGFQIDDAKLSGLDMKGNHFRFRAKKIQPINEHLPIISGANISGTIKFSPEILIKIQAEKANFDTRKNLINLKGELKLENKNFKLLGSAITIDFRKNIIHSNEKITIRLLDGEIKAGKIKVQKKGHNNSDLKFLMENGVLIKYFL